MANFFVNVLSPQSLANATDGKCFLSTLCNLAPHLAPQLYGTHEPLRKRFDPTDIESALAAWKAPSPFLWRRKQPGASGGVFIMPGSIPLHAIITLRSDSLRYTAEAVTVLQQFSLDFDADFAFVHSLSEDDIHRGLRAGVVSPLNRAGTRFTMIVTTHILRRYLPDIYWATLFGLPYVRHFGRERLLAAPAPLVQELPNGAIYLQMSSDEVELGTFRRVRERVKAHLGIESFFDERADIDHEYSVPEFRFDS